MRSGRRGLPQIPAEICFSSVKTAIYCLFPITCHVQQKEFKIKPFLKSVFTALFYRNSAMQYCVQEESMTYISGPITGVEAG